MLGTRNSLRSSNPNSTWFRFSTCARNCTRSSYRNGYRPCFCNGSCAGARNSICSRPRNSVRSGPLSRSRNSLPFLLLQRYPALRQASLFSTPPPDHYM